MTTSGFLSTAAVFSQNSRERERERGVEAFLGVLVGRGTGRDWEVVVNVFASKYIRGGEG